ncbi:MAG: hypothetical protein JWQ87_2031 [Candidatus Sulfotelmatobacter sp.]|nr:hypothetical protein [Candidatus Sulfotelmatobacter sp.]
MPQLLDVFAVLFFIAAGGLAVWGVTKYRTLEQDNEYAYEQLRLAREESATYREDAAAADASAAFQKETLSAVLSRPVVATLSNEQAQKLIEAVRVFIGANAVAVQ